MGKHQPTNITWRPTLWSKDRGGLASLACPPVTISDSVDTPHYVAIHLAPNFFWLLYKPLRSIKVLFSHVYNYHKLQLTIVNLVMFTNLGIYSFCPKDQLWIPLSHLIFCSMVSFTLIKIAINITMKITGVRALSHV